MTFLKVTLLGRLEITTGESTAECLIRAGKAQELFCYLLIHQNHPHTREKLGVLLWQNASAQQAKQYLRTALWQVQSALMKLGVPLIVSDSSWLQLVTHSALSADTVRFEDVFKSTHTIRATELTAGQAKTMKSTIALYQGSLLEDWYQDWCIIERERFQNMYLTMLEKILLYCQITGAYAEGIEYGLALLNVDNAHERTHRRLMRLYYLDGDRTTALRQYQRCEAILRSEFQVAPSYHTTLLYEQIKEDRFPEPLAQP
ncbi:MAG TPA: BTAD domain-containing putative transcriptional regulator [Promineifilum sp.]|nr:BTAD domain-containing putative transcriptional regulator [Promineifilum sp.]